VATNFFPREFLKKQSPESFSDSVLEERPELDRSMLEGYAVGSQNVYDLELLVNLWYLLHTQFKKGSLEESEAELEARTKIVARELERLSQEHDRPSTALQAQTLHLHMKLLMCESGEIDPLLRDIQDVVLKGKELIGYPLEPLVKILTMWGDFLGDRAAYQALFDTIVEVVSARDGEVAAARMLLKRGAQQVNADRPTEAVKTFGSLFGYLYKHESRRDLIRALYLASFAYERVGLLWAARGTALTAASLATDDFWLYGEITPNQAACYTRLKWIELQLGRLPQTLEWHQTERAASSVLVDRGYNAERLDDGQLDFDAIVGMLFLRADLWELKHLSSLPDVLDKLGLHRSAIALRFSLGHDEDPRQYLLQEGDGCEALYNFFVLWRDQPAGKDLPAVPLLNVGRKVSLRSNVLGCQITGTSENAPQCVALAESVLAALESLLSTALLGGAASLEPVLTIEVRKSDFTEGPFKFEMISRDGRPHVEIRVGAFNPHSIPPETQARLRKELLDLLMSLLTKVFVIKNPEESIVRLFRDEHALERSLDFTSSFVSLSNVLGNAPRTTISAWSDPDADNYALRRTEEWDAADRRAKLELAKTAVVTNPTFGTGDPPPELPDTGRTKHSQIETVSLIRNALWDQAKWSGTLFAWTANTSDPPVMAPIFKNAEAAAQIFSLWRKELGTNDEDEWLRISIISGISKTNPFAYRDVIGLNPLHWSPRPDVEYIVAVFRLSTMLPESDHNLREFLNRYETSGQYFLAYAVQRTSSKPELLMDTHIGKREVYVREAWTIGRHDIDSVGVLADDDPIVPSEQNNPPVNDLLKWKRHK